MGQNDESDQYGLGRDESDQYGLGRDESDRYGYVYRRDESDFGYRDFYDSLSAEQKGKLKDLQDLARDFEDNLSKDQKEQSLIFSRSKILAASN